MAEIPIRPIYKNTTIDPPGTIKHVAENGVEMVRPKKDFFTLLRENGFPTRRARFCCKFLKEYKIMDNAIQGVRRAESVKRANNYDAQEPVICRVYGKKENHVNVVLPILNWTDTDIAEFVNQNNVKCHSLYYDEDGRFHAERRLGCLCCPLASGNGLVGFKQYPQFVKLWLRNANVWWEKPRKEIPNSHIKFPTIHDAFYHNVFCNSYDEYYTRKHGMFGERDFKKEMEDYFGIDLTID